MVAGTSVGSATRLVGGMFDLIVLSADRKFLSRARCQTPLDVANLLLKTLKQPVVGRVSIQRVPERKTETH